MEKPFDPTKPVETRNGQTVRIICTDAKADIMPVIALVMDKATGLISRSERRFTDTQPAEQHHLHC